MSSLKRDSRGQIKSAIETRNDESTRQRSIEMAMDMLQKMVNKCESEKIIQKQLGIIGSLTGNSKIYIVSP
jgi:hypothetical protein